MFRSSRVVIAMGALAASAQQVNAQGGNGNVLAQPGVMRSSTVPGQPVESCIAGRVFGITEFRCTSCGMSSPRDSTHIVYSFGSQPFVVETDNPTNRIKPGDQVVAVNGYPITTRAGADQFAYPPVGTATITVLRNNVNINIDHLISTTRYCPGTFVFRSVPDSSGARIIAATPRSGAAGGGSGGGGRGGARLGAGMIARVDTGTFTRAQIDSITASMRARGTLLRAAPTEQIQNTVNVPRFGLLLKCLATCTLARTRDGTAQYWRFDGFPIIAGPAASSIAAMAGLRDGDVLISVNGVSPQVEEGALMLTRDPVLRLEVRRGDTIEKITLKM